MVYIITVAQYVWNKVLVMRPERMKYLVLIINLYRNHISVQDGLYVFSVWYLWSLQLKYYNRHRSEVTVWLSS